MPTGNNEVKTPKWDEDGKLFRDLALTTVSLSNLQDLLDSQANAASCLQLAYLSTSSIVDVQNGIHEAAILLESADANATVTMTHSAQTAAAIMDILPTAFELLKSKLPYAQELLYEMANYAEKIQKRFKEVAAEYMICSSMLSNSLNKGNIARAELEQKLEEATEATTSAKVYAEQYQKAADDYIELLSTLKKEQETLEAEMDDVIHEKFVLALTKTLMGIFSFVMSFGMGASTTDSSSSLGSSAPSDSQAANHEKHVKLLANAKAKVEGLEHKLSKMGDAPDEKRNEVTKELDTWKETVRNEEAAINDALHSIIGASSEQSSADISDVAKAIVARAKVVEERQRNAEAQRAAAKANAIKYQAQLTALAKQAEFDAPHLDQIKAALANLAKASTSVQALAVFWQSVQTVLDTLASTNHAVARPDYLAALGKLSPSVFASVMNLSVAPGLTEIYGSWWAVKDICNAYTTAAVKIIDPAVGKSMYKWISAAPGSDDIKKLLTAADEKAKAGELIMDPPIMGVVGFISKAA